MRNLITRALRVTLLVGLVGCGGQGDSNSVDAEAQSPSEGMVEVNGVDLHYLDWGGEGQLLLFVSGLTETAYTWSGIAPHYADRYRVIALTPREHGASDKPGPPYSIESFGADLAAAIAHFSDGPAIVVGHSFAGATMVELARRDPSSVAGLVFIDALYDFSANSDPEPSVPWPTLPSAYPTVDAAVQSYLEVGPTFLPELLEPLLRSKLSEDEAGQLVETMSPATLQQLREVHAAYSPGDFRAIEVPVLTVRVKEAAAIEARLSASGFPPDSVAAGRRWAEGWDDVWKSSAEEQLLRAVPDAQVVVLDSVTHGLPIERPDLVIGHLDDFLASTVSPGN